MEQECQSLVKCGFLKKYQATKDLACKGFILQFCKGPNMNECKRMQYRLKNGAPPSDDMMPNGQMISIANI